MPKILKFRRGSTQELSQLTGAEGELFVDLTKDSLVVMDGVTQGGSTMQKELVSGSSIKTLNGLSILGSGNIAITQLDTENFTTRTFLETALSGKQDVLLPGSNIKTINGQNVLGQGNLTVAADLTGYATEQFVNNQIISVVDAAPGALNTLKELAAALGDDANYASTITTALSAKANISSLASIATSGSYTDLINKPSLFSGSYADLSNKPSLFSGVYTDLINKPTIPTAVSQLANDSGFVTTSAVSNKQDALVSGSTIKTINGTSILGSGNIVITAGGDLTGYATQSYVTTEIQNIVGAAPAALNTLTELAAALGNDASYASTITTALSAKANISSLATVATSGSYTDLTNQPSLFSGLYTDLGDKPTAIPIAPQWTANHTLLPGGVNTRYLVNDVVYENGLIFRALFDNESVPTYNLQYWEYLGPGSRLNIDGRDIPNITYGQLSNKPTIPTAVSQLTNDSGFINNFDISDKQPNLISGLNIKTVGGTSILGSGDISLPQTYNQNLNTYNEVQFSKINTGEMYSSLVSVGDNLKLSNTFGQPGQIAAQTENNTAWVYLHTINGQSLLGSGNITISGGAGGGVSGSLDFGTFTSPAGFTLDMGTF